MPVVAVAGTWRRELPCQALAECDWAADHRMPGRNALSRSVFSVYEHSTVRSRYAVTVGQPDSPGFEPRPLLPIRRDPAGRAPPAAAAPGRSPTRRRLRGSPRRVGHPGPGELRKLPRGRTVRDRGSP
eukprot:111875-Hanusia_phi.AAC.2